MTEERYHCNLCERQIESLGRHRGLCHTLRRQGPAGAESRVFGDDTEYVRHGDIHICPSCWEGLAGLFQKQESQ